MANLPESSAAFPAGVYQIETTDPVVGGTPNEGTGAGMSNIPHKQLADRTAFLKASLDALSSIALTTSNSPRLLAQTGYFRFGAGGLMLQWGRFTLTEPPTSVSFPTPFSTACFGVVLSDTSTATLPERAHAVSVLLSSITVNGFTGFARDPDVAALEATDAFFLALGH